MSFLNPKNFFFEEKKTDFWRNIKTILDKKIPWPSSSRYTTRIMQEKKNGVFPTIWGFKEPPPPRQSENISETFSDEKCYYRVSYLLS